MHPLRLNVSHARFCWLCTVLGAMLLAGAGCSRQKGQVVVAEEHIKKAARLYERYGQTHQNKPPPNEAEFKKFLDGLKEKDLKDLNIDEDVTKAMISPRDGKPYGIVYGVTFGPPPGANKSGPGGKMQGRPPTGQMKPPVILYEQDGVGGKRYVAYLMGGGFQEVDEAIFRDLVPSAK